MQCSPVPYQKASSNLCLSLELPFGKMTFPNVDVLSSLRFFLEAHFVTTSLSLSVYPMTLGKSPNTRRIKEGLHRKTRTKCW